MTIAGDAHARVRAHDVQFKRGDLALDEASFDLTHVAVSPNDLVARATPAITLDRIAFHAKSARVKFADPLARLDIGAEVVAGRVLDSAALNGFLPANSKFAVESDGATFSADAHADLVASVARGAVMLHASKLGVGGKIAHLRGDVALTADGLTWNLAHDTVSVEGAALLVHDITGRFAGTAPQFSIKRILAMGKTDGFDLAHPSLAGLQLQIGIDDATLPNVKDAGALLPADSVLGLESGHLNVSAALTLSPETGRASGGLDISLKDGGLRFHTAHYHGDFAFDGAIAGFDVADTAIDFSGSVLRMRDVIVSNAPTATSRWHGDLFFEKGTIALGDKFLVDTYVALDARDADPLLAVALGDDLPDAFSAFAKMPHLLGTGHLTLASHSFSLRDMEAHGGDLKLRGIYAAKGKHVRGGFALTKAGLSGGVRLDDRGAHVHLMDLDPWLREQTSAAMLLIDDDPAPTLDPGDDGCGPRSTR
jgi:hypothetical protein